MNGLPELPYEIPPGTIDFHRRNAHRLRSEYVARFVRGLLRRRAPHAGADLSGRFPLYPASAS